MKYRLNELSLGSSKINISTPRSGLGHIWVFCAIQMKIKTSAPPFLPPLLISVPDTDTDMEQELPSDQHAFLSLILHEEPTVYHPDISARGITQVVAWGNFNLPNP